MRVHRAAGRACPADRRAAIKWVIISELWYGPKLMTDAVRDQYEDLPYPPRDPEDERQRLVTGSPSQIVEIDHYLHAGARDWTEPFRVLVAGGGTGDALIMIAQQLADRGCPAEIHYLDLSTASRAIAEQRARIRGLSSIIFHTGSLLDAGDHGTFDYIDCCGVLHHLEDPVAALNGLTGLLAEDGGIDRKSVV